MTTLRARSSLTALGGLSALLVLGCGGGGQGSPASTAPKAIASAETLRLTESFLQVEGRQSQPGSMPFTALAQPGSGLPTAAAAAAEGCPTFVIEYPDPNTMKVTFEFAGCPKEVAAAITGRILLTITLFPSTWTVVYDDLTAVSGTQRWQMAGTKGVAKDAVKKESRIQTQNFTVSYTDSANPSGNRSFAYGSDLTGSWATAGEYRVWGTYTLTANGEAPVTATIAKDQPLVFTAGCCYPTAGSIHFTKGEASADATFQAPCGTVKVQPAGGAAETRTLAACR